MIYYLIVLIGVFACSTSQLLLKKSASVEHESRLNEILNWRVILSYGVMFITLITNIYAMNHGVMLKDMPILEATGYIFVAILSYFFLKERMNKTYICSLFLILIGIFVFYI